MKKPTYEELNRELESLKKELRQQTSLAQRLKESEDIYKTIWESSLAGIFVSQGGLFQLISPIALSFTGYGLDELVGRRADSIILPEDRENVKSKARTMLSGVRTNPIEFRVVTKDGDIRWVMETVTSTFFKGKPAILGNSMDVTMRKTVEKKLRESENLYRAIFETTGTAMIIIEEDKTISLLNSEFEKMTGYTRDEWEGKKKWTEYVAPKDLPKMNRYHAQRRQDASAAPRNYEHDLIDARGRIRHIFLTVDMIPGTQKSVASFTDITAWKAAERGLKKREAELQIKSRSLEELNTALRVLLKEREKDRADLEDKVLSNIQNLVLPYVQIIRESRINPKTMAYVDILDSNLMDIVSPFAQKLSAKYKQLTPKEIQIAHFIKDGKTSKEIAHILNVSKSAVDMHRYRLRNKLGLNKLQVNLQSHLTSLV